MSCTPDVRCTITVSKKVEWTKKWPACRIPASETHAWKMIAASETKARVACCAGQHRFEHAIDEHKRCLLSSQQTCKTKQFINVARCNRSGGKDRILFLKKPLAGFFCFPLVLSKPWFSPPQFKTNLKVSTTIAYDNDSGCQRVDKSC